MVRTAVFFLFILITWYLAGMYRYPVLLVLLGIEMILLPGSIFLARFFRRTLQVEFSVKSKNMIQGEETGCRMETIYEGALPVSRFSLKIELFYVDDERHLRKKYEGSCERGTNEVFFSLCPPYCGILEVQIKMIRTYDYFSLCSAKKKAQDHMQVLVFPKPVRLKFLLISSERNAAAYSEEKTVGKYGGGNNEIRQLREYQPGDPIRHIHWNLSARTDSIWLKEFYRETTSTVYVTLDLYGTENSLLQRSAFYTLLYALIMGLLEHAPSVRIQWFDWQREIWHEEKASDEDDCRDILGLLYFEKCLRITKEDMAKFRKIPEKEDFRLNLYLELYAGDEQIHRFSPDNLEEEITRNVFVL